MTNELSVKCLLARENINMHEGGWVYELTGLILV